MLFLRHSVDAFWLFFCVNVNVLQSAVILLTVLQQSMGPTERGTRAAGDGGRW